MGRNHWLLKSEPGTYSIDDLQRDGVTCWEGVRNYQARNTMRDLMEVGDRALFYHSRSNPPGVVGVAEVCRSAYPDHYSWDPDSPYFDPKSTPEAPRWFMVDVAFVEKLPRTIALSELKADPALEGMEVVRKGSRLSVQPVAEAHFEHILHLAKT